MEQEFLKTIVNVQPSQERDLNAPYSFLEWKQQRPTVLEKDVFLYYNRYILEWFDKNKQKKISTKFLLRQKYLFLLEQLQLFFTTTEKNNWYNKINFAEEKELLLGIPFFAKKLRKIALYYLKLRKRLKTVKIKYNSVGSVRGVQQEIYQHIIENFSSSNDEFDPEFQEILPDIDVLKNQLVVRVEEIYDDGEYFDKSLTTPVSSYIDIFHEPTAKLFLTKGIILSSDEWAFNSFSFPTTATVEAFVSGLTSNIFSEQTDVNLYGTFVQQFLAEDKFNLQFQKSIITSETYNVPLQQGNNYFFYPYGTTDTSLSIERPITSAALSSLSIPGATSGDALSSSDTIFVKNGDEVKAAWLHFKDFQDDNEEVVALINNKATTSFIFPFPGYGLSAEDIDWTGPSLETEDEYLFLPPLIKANVNEAYWSQFLPSDSTNSIALNESTLADGGAKASKNPAEADNIFIRNNRVEDTTIPRGSLSGAWLYKFERAALPVSTGADQSNTVLWPYSRTDKFDDEEFLNYLSKTSLSAVCNPISVQDLDCSYFVAASSFELADKIYKIENYANPSALDATECCWLSSGEVISGDYKYFNQRGMSFLFQPTEETKFVWSGPTMPLSSVFSGVDHDSDCPHVSDSKLNWQQCSCKQVYYSPFGHSDKTFELGNRHADFICKAPDEYSEEFTLDAWSDDSDNTFRTSEQFAWYRTQSTWGKGTWSKADGTISTMMLEQGKPYIYRRAGSRTDVEHPPYAALKRFYKSSHECFSSSEEGPAVKWILAKKSDTGEWISTDEESPMIFVAGDFINFDKQQNTTFAYLSTVLIERQSENRGSVWAASDYIAFESASPSTSISWPFIEGPFLLENYETQAPPVAMQNLSAILAWKIECDQNPSLVDILESPYTDFENLSTRTYSNIFTFTFVPPQTGTYSVSVTAVDNNQQVYVIPNSTTTIPKLSVVSQYEESKIDITFETPQASVLVEHPLNGWNYTISTIGAKPYWAKLDSEKSSATKFKGIREWGYENTYHDEYVPNMLPKLSPLMISYGDVIDYDRKGRSFYWSQPIVYRTFINEPEWCKLTYDISTSSNLSSVYDISLEDTLKVFPTLSATDIILTNNINGAPVEIYYYALNSLVWTTSAEIINEPLDPTSTLYYDSNSSGLNLTNRFYPTVATLPTLAKTYTEKQVGSYFTPQNLGASQYINTNFTTNLINPELTGSYVVEDVTIHVGGRGFTYSDQPTLHDWEENNEWLKEPPGTNGLAGSVKKELTKTLQTFIPYQASMIQDSIGMVSYNNKFTPWGGEYADQWIDKTNEPKSYTGVRNVSAWQSSQELSKTQLSLDAWTSDIYGNQYGLFKDLSGVPIWQRPIIPGELWVKTNGSAVSPATKALSSLFIQFVQSSTIYNELTGKQILNVDCFFDTIMIEASSTFIISRVTYDYDIDQIAINTDDTRYKLLADDSFRFEQTWFLPQEKSLICMFTEISSNSFFPNLYSYDQNTGNFLKTFPIKSSDYNTLEQGLSAYNPQSGKFCYNDSTRTYGITYHALDSNDDVVFINIKLNRLEDLVLDTIDIYENRSAYQINVMPPILLNYYLSAVPVTTNSSFAITVSALNNPTSYELIQIGEGTNQISLSSSGTFTGILTSDGLYHVNYTISNEVGSTQYCLTLSAT